MTNQRRPESMYRLRARTIPENEERARRRQQSRWNGNGQGATNDSEEFKVSVRIVDGYPVEYSCRDDPRRQNNVDDVKVSQLSIDFDYEMITLFNAEVVESIRSLEWSLLWNVARNMGLHNCNYGKQEEPLFEFEDGVRHLLSPESYVVALSSLDLDAVDDSIDFCTVLTKPDAGSVCTPMVGRMTAQFMGDEKTISKYLEQNIKLELNSRRVRIEKVKECRYVGDRKELNINANVREELQSKNSTMNLALVFGVLAGVFILGFALLMARGRRRRQEHVLDDNGALPHSIPTVIVSKTAPRRSRDCLRRSSSADTQESVPDNNDATVPCAQDGIGIREVSVPITSSQASQSQSADEQKTSAVFGDDANTESSATTTPADVEDKENVGVPPVPSLCVVPADGPQKPKELTAAKPSKTLQPKRRRRKKKKKRVLKRISSRSSIDEMETIKEDDESVDEEGSEFDGSEYSTDDEDFDTIGSLGDNNGTGIEPPDTSIPPSPIREEPKIRRLPPPWI